jgi:hypothetical protein
MAEAGAHPRVLISYTHDSQEHKHRVLALSERLRGEGVDCHLDQYVEFPVQGWPRWMLHEIKQAEHILVVCTEIYERRALGYEEQGRGLGATWEGLVITQELYDAGGRNTKFIPVVFSASDAQHIPVYLRGSTYYNLGSEDAYDRLYALLTNQPRIVPRELGPRRPVLPINTPPVDPGVGPVEQPKIAALSSPKHDRALVLIQIEGLDDTYFLSAERVDEEESSSTLVLAPDSARESASMENLRGSHKPQVIIAHDFTAYRGTVRSVVRSRQGKEERWTVQIERSLDKWDFFTSEINVNGISADEVAEMRARRILLNEGQSRVGTDRERLNDLFMEHYIAGEQYGLSVARSPFPRLFGELRHDPATFLEAARLLAVLLLKLTHVVAHVYRLDLELIGGDRLAVTFEGQRRQVYSNVPATLINVEGTCAL